MVMKQHALVFVAAFSILGLCSGVPCTAVLAQGPAGPEMRVLAVETFLADIAQNVAGDRFKVPALLPIGADPHGFQPTPADVAKVANCNVLIVHGPDPHPVRERAGGELRRPLAHRRCGSPRVGRDCPLL